VVLQCGAAAWLYGLASGDHRQFMGRGSASEGVAMMHYTKLNGGLSRLHSADEDAVSWLTNYGK